MTISILPLEGGATHVENLQAGIEMPSLFPLLEEREKSVTNFSTIQPFNHSTK